VTVYVTVSQLGALYIRKFELTLNKTRNVRSGSAFGLASALLFSGTNEGIIKKYIQNQEKQDTGRSEIVLE